MKSRHSSSLILIWRIAEFEARHQNAATIDLTHLLLGLCKVVDLDLPELVSKNLADRNEVLEELLREVRKLRIVFCAVGLDAKTFRRRLRRIAIEPRFSLLESDRLRRSPAAKQVFTDAERMAQLASGIVYPVHLLYASLLAENSQRDALLAELNVNKRQFLTAAKRQIVLTIVQTSCVSKNTRSHWN